MSEIRSNKKQENIGHNTRKIAILEGVIFIICCAMLGALMVTWKNGSLHTTILFILTALAAILWLILFVSSYTKYRKERKLLGK